MKRVWIALLLFSVALLLAATCLAGNNSKAGIALHIEAPQLVAKNICTEAGPVHAGLVDHSDLGYTCFGEYMSIYVFVCNGSHRNAELINQIGGVGFDVDGTGVAGATFGLTYSPGIIVSAWYSCTDLEFADPAWPASGTGGTWTWDSQNNCQGVPSPTSAPNEVITIIGVLNLWASPGTINITANPTSGEAAVIDCYSVNDRVDAYAPTQLGSIGFCTPGFSPCGFITPVSEQTWGGIKKLYH